jgi:SAM-dependent methyltransferase
MMVDDEAMWADGRRWVEGAVEHTRAAARFSGVQPRERVLDIGCGIGGPARTLATEFGADVYAISDEKHMLDTARRLNEENTRAREAIELAHHDCQLPYVESGFDLAWSMNMIYHVPDKRAMLRCAYDALRPGGRLMVEDWMLTPRATEQDVSELEHHFKARHFARVDQLIAEILATGYDLAALEDLGHVGRTHMANYSTAQMREYFTPLLVADHGEYGSSMAEDFIAGVSVAVRMYRDRRMTYLRQLATRD